MPNATTCAGHTQMPRPPIRLEWARPSYHAQNYGESATGVKNCARIVPRG
jgi:hypothetical protein